MRPLNPKLWLAPVVALAGFSTATVVAVPTEDCSVCGCLDCNNNGVDDRCDVACSNSGTYCDGTPPQALSATCSSGFFPSCATSVDCNANGIPDECDIAGGTGCDANLNTIPDECEFQIPANVLFVEDDAPPGGDGSTWCTAFQSLQDALAASVAGDTIRIAQGTYLPVDCAPTCGPADRTATFNLKNGVTIQGAYAGLGAPDPNARDIAAYETNLSGDLLGDDVVFWGRPNKTVVFQNSLENVLHVVTAVSVDSTTVVDGVTIRGGLANGTGNDRLGAGMSASGSTLTIVDCTFTGNSSNVPEGDGGGGGLMSLSSAPTLDRCVFRLNQSNMGGGMFILGPNVGDTATLTDCTFINNKVSTITKAFGGGVYVKSSSPELRNCKFLENDSEEGGGGLCNAFQSHTKLINCVFSGNSAYNGGGVGNRIASNGLVINCSFSNNCACVSGSNFYNNRSTPTLWNSVFFKGDNTGCQQPTGANIEGLNTGDNKRFKFGFLGDPGFVNALGADGMPGTEDDDLRLDTGSPAIDAGDNDPVLGIACVSDTDCTAVGFQACIGGICDALVISTDFDGNPRIVDGGGCGATVDIGAFEVQIDCGNGVCDPGENSCSCEADCGPAPSENTPLTCSDGVDNDCNCLVDCEDSACIGVTPENCTDFVDNDCDGNIDCADSDCATSQYCGGGPQ